MPGLPGAKISAGFREDWESLRPKACSRPPDPMTRIFMGSKVNSFQPSAISDQRSALGKPENPWSIVVR
jgi:hypothetical protein